MSNNKGFLPTILEEGNNIEYDPKKGITMDELAEWCVSLSKIKPRKPEYILSKTEAEKLPLWQLTWLGENNIVLCSLEVSNIITERFKNEKNEQQ